MYLWLAQTPLNQYPWTFILILCWSWCSVWNALLKWFTGVALLWGLNKTDLKTESNLNFLLCYITLGHFLLLSPSPAAEDSGICEYHLTSPVLPRSDGNCIFQVALYEAGAAAGNLTLLIKPLLLGSAVHSVVLNHRSHDDHRLASTLRAYSPCHCNAVCVEQLFISLVHYLCSTTDQLN